MGRIKDAFYLELENKLNFWIKYNGMDEDDAKEILEDFTFEGQKAWMDWSEERETLAEIEWEDTHFKEILGKRLKEQT